MSGELASVKLRDLVEDPVAGFWGSSEKTVSTPVAAAVVRNGDVPGERIVSVDELPVRWFSRAEIEKAAVHPDDTVVVSSGYIGKSGRIVGCGHRTVIASNFVRRLRARDGVDARWLFHLIGGAAVRQAMYRNAGGSTIVNLSSGYLDEPLGLQAIPTNHEQRCIAEILDTVDEAIRKTEQVITKLQQMKQGLLHDLLTRGIDENGELRDPERHPEQFKDSPLGRIPREWEVRRLESLVDILDHLRVPVNSDERAKRPGEVPYYGANGQQGWIDRPLFNEPLVLLAEDGGNFDDFHSRPIAYRIDGPSWVNNHAHVIRALSGVDHDFTFWSLVHKDIRQYIAGGTRSKLTQGELRAIEVPTPPLAEQQHIARILDEHEGRVKAEETGAGKLRLLKQGLMDDLLTGRIRVPLSDERDP